MRKLLNFLICVFVLVVGVACSDSENDLTFDFPEGFEFELRNSGGMYPGGYLAKVMTDFGYLENWDYFDDQVRSLFVFSLDEEEILDLFGNLSFEEFKENFKNIDVVRKEGSFDRGGNTLTLSYLNDEILEQNDENLEQIVKDNSALNFVVKEDLVDFQEIIADFDRFFNLKITDVLTVDQLTDSPGLADFLEYDLPGVKIDFISLEDLKNAESGLENLECVLKFGGEIINYCESLYNLENLPVNFVENGLVLDFAFGFDVGLNFSSTENVDFDYEIVFELKKEDYGKEFGFVYENDELKLVEK